jgi:hypothetical protein
MKLLIENIEGSFELRYTIKTDTEVTVFSSTSSRLEDTIHICQKYKMDFASVALQSIPEFLHNDKLRSLLEGIYTLFTQLRG